MEGDEKKRFFKDELDSSVELSLANKSSFLFDAQEQGDEEGIMISGEQEVVKANDNSGNTFIDQLIAVVPSIDQHLANTLSEKYKDIEDGLDLALSEYFDQHQDDIQILMSSPSKVAPLSAERTLEASSQGIQDVSEIVEESSPVPKSKSQEDKIKAFFGAGHHKRKHSSGLVTGDTSMQKKKVEWKKFIGSLQVTVMVTRPSMRPIPYGSPLLIRRSNNHLSVGKLYEQLSKKKTALAAFVKVFSSNNDREIGRVPEDIARITFPLLLRDEVSFEATMIYSGDKRLSIGDSVIVQLDCYLTSLLFDPSAKTIDSFANKKPRKERFGAIVETDQELEDRTVRMALIMLFDKIRLKPVKDENKSLEQYEKNFNQTEVVDLDDEESLQEYIYQESEDIAATQHQEETMDVNQLTSFYRASQSSKKLENLQETEPPNSLVKLNLRKYQKQGLTWMLKREGALKTDEVYDNESNDDTALNPLWRQFMWPKNMSWTAQKSSEQEEYDISSIFFYGNLYTGEFSLKKPTLDSFKNGGILSDEMGLGKTISALSLVLMRPSDNSKTEQHLFNDENLNADSEDIVEISHSTKAYASKTTLIIVPMSLLTQWRDEFLRANNCSDYTCELYYGGNVSSLKVLLTKNKKPPTVVLTTYGIVQNEWTKIAKNTNTEPNGTSSSGLFSIEFFRIILDEGHTIRNRSTITSKAVFGLSAKYKWVLTGTPIINKLDDLYSLVKFLKLEPWSQIGYWKMFITTPFENRNFKQAFDVVNAIIEPVVLRRTKQMKDVNGKPLVELPPKEVIIEKLQFNKKQKFVYEELLKRAEKSFKSGLLSGDLLKKYSTILVHILRLRQVCCDSSLLGTLDENDEDLATGNNKLIAESTDVDALLPSDEDQSNEAAFTDDELLTVSSNISKKFIIDGQLAPLECSICTTEPIDPSVAVITECEHVFCKECLEEYGSFQKEKSLEQKCPNCRRDFSMKRLFTLEKGEEGHQIPVYYDRNDRPSKLNALLKHLQQLQDRSAGEQVVVFSQFSSYLDILEQQLSETFAPEKLKVYKFDGRLSLKDRTSVLEEFKIKDYSTQKVLLLSLKAGGVGLNLTCASYAFMMDPWWSPSMEDQAIDRIHRIGQANSVKVYRFIVEGTIEEKMLKIQERKRTLGEAMDTDEDERRKRRIEEIQMLFQQ
ncbi:DNA repair protein RAD5 [Nakaseomyces bracarensis]|uniref:DNA repair protein RAD5 n=1 Tax=Nakaseomyces bracarensis TaxID=273131 RepID=A0ABR4NVJ2_9SACH